MLRNYLKVALRHLRRNRIHSFINITGLAVGMACCVVLLIYVQHEISYDRHHKKGDHIYRLAKGNSANSPELWARALETELPEITHAVRLMHGFSQALVAYDDQQYREPLGLYADAKVFDVFTWPLLQGNPQTALQAPFTVVLSQSMARKYFGDANPLGQTLTIVGISNAEKKRDYRVTGVLAPQPGPSHIPFEYLVSFESVEVLNAAGEWGTPLSWTNRMTKTYLLLRDQSDPAMVAAQLPAFFERHIANEQYNRTDAQLQSLTDIRLRSNLQAEFEAGGTIASVYLFSALAGFILLIACINFMNLTTARAQQRVREVGVRKVLGAQRIQLVKQFLGESLLLSFLALLFAIILLEAALPLFNALAQKSLSLDYLANGPILLGLLGLTLLVGFASGCYPALFLSRFRPARVLKTGLSNSRRGMTLRRSLVVFQFVVSTLLVASTAIVYDQLDYFQSKDLGFQEDQVVVLPIGRSASLNANWQVVKQELQQHPNILNVSGTHSLPSQFLNGFTYLPEGAAPEDRVPLSSVSMDHDLIETLEMRLLAGRALSALLASDSTAFVLNEAAVQAMGWASPEDAIGKQMEWLFPNLGFQGPVIGVVQDFHYQSLHNAISPMAFHITRFGANFIAARIRPENVPATLAHFETVWHQFETEFPFEYFFLNEQFAQQYEAEQRLGRIFGYGAGLAIVVACLGLFGLSAFTAEQRTKEIGVRKVLGASVGKIMLLLTKEFALLVCIALALAFPLGYLAMETWLAQFAYRIDISIWTFAVAGLLTLTVALLTVSYQSIKAALTDPVKSLRYE